MKRVVLIACLLAACCARGDWTIGVTDGNIDVADGVIRAISAGVSATGGTITYTNGYTIHTFTTNGTFTVNTSLTVDVLVVAGGGGGGGSVGHPYSGGGGAGGLIYTQGLAIVSSNYAVSVGLGGDTNTNGVNSTAFGITTLGGGAGGDWGTGLVAQNGGSGGGARLYSTAGSGVAGQGYAGGEDVGNEDPPHKGGGSGGGSSGVGGAGSLSAGGLGTTNSISGIAVVYSSGGSQPSGESVAPNNSGDGGGTRTGYVGKSGGSGVVVVRYLE